MPYDRQKAVQYARKWALKRNPAYANFNSMGGDCTNFISQCLFAGVGVMNYKKDVGWYYNSLSDRSAAWSGVEYLHRFLVSNKEAGPYAEELPIESVTVGDIIQLSFNGSRFAHSLFVTKLTGDPANTRHILVTTHTFDSLDRPLSSYSYQKSRLLHIAGVN
ncbi:MAG: amidase domain-containing protein [Oscillospiraceae bacterium]|jgi:hypothetical protein|nr:amidase domain-containing protein [Oscillospiraceae bacterium]